MSPGTIIAIAVPVLVVLAGVLLFAAARRRDTDSAQGVLSSETLQRDRGPVRLGEGERRMLTTVPSLRGGPEVLERARELGEPVQRATERLGATYEAVTRRGVADRVQIDLGLLRDLGYYTGTIVEVYDPALGHILGGGGRYDELMGRFGRPLPAVGFALYLERLHIAQAEEERLAREGEAP